MRFSARAYSRVTFVALVLLCTIVVTGAAVRLSGSGLGCSDWPRCNSQKFIDVSSTHGAIEQVNRLFTGLVAVGVALAVLGSYRLSERRRNLVRLSWGLVGGVIGQVVLGGIVVLTDLHPLANQGHFVLSMILVSTATVLWENSKTKLISEVGSSKPLSPMVHRLAVGVVVGVVGSIFTGTVVTGTGPHAGDEEARRFGFEIESVARVHGSSVLVTLTLLLGLIVVVRRRAEYWDRLGGTLEALLAVGALQATVGYVQYFNDIPAVLVCVHVAGATAMMIAVVRFAHRVFSRPEADAPVPLETR